MDVNTCFETTNAYHIVAYYSHLVPVALGMFLSIYALFRAKFSKLAVLFFGFTLSFSLWLIGDLIVWVSPNYDLVYFFWSWLDFLDVVFFVLGAYFFAMLVRGKVSLLEKAVLLALCAPAFAITVSGHSLLEFYQPVCEALENENLVLYRLFAEGVAVLLMLVTYVAHWTKSDARQRIQASVILFALLLFFGTFSGTGYLASTTYIYEINLYGLLVLPLFLIIMTFAITDLKLFQFRFVGTQILAYVLIIMVGSQLLFIQDSTSQSLSLVTLGISLFLGALLVENAKKEAEARVKIESLAKDLASANDRLKELDRMKSEFVSIAAHQLRAPITAIRGYVANILEGGYGVLPDAFKEPIGVLHESSRLMANSIEDYLNVSRIEQGRMKYEKSQFDLSALAKKVVEELTPVASKKSLGLSISAPDAAALTADMGKVKQVLTNLIDNAIKYTKEGSVSVSVEKKDAMLRVTIADTGVGIPADEIGHLFEKFTRARGANKVNATGTGLGLYVAKQLVEGHGGKVWAESDGEGKGSRFIFELPAA